MVKLTITPHRGNGARTFPSTGFLGMTPVTLAGVVRVKIEEDLKTIEASSLVIRVRCYESLGNGRDGGASSTSTSSTERRSSASAASSGYHSSSCLGGNASHSSSYSFSDIFKSGAPSSSSSSHTNSTASSSKGRVLYEKSVQMWSPPTTSMKKNQDASTSTASSPLSSRSSSQDTTSSLPPPPQQQHAYPPRSREASTCSSTSNDTDSYATLGDFTKAWRIVIPVNAVEQGAKSTMIFKNWRIWWAVEAVISHRPSGIHGDKIIKSHQVALLSYAPLPSSSVDTPLTWSSSPNDPHPLSYHITTPKSSLGSNDPITFDVRLSKKSIMAETPKKVIIELRREICFCAGGIPESNGPSSRDLTEAHQSKNDATKNTTASRPSKHARSTSGGGLLPNIVVPSPPIAHIPYLISSSTGHHTKFKSESTEALVITPPPLSNTSTMSSFSTYMPATPPSNIPTPSEYIDGPSESSYFGLFSKGSSHSKSHQYHHQHSYVPPPPISITLPSSTTRSHNHHHLNNDKKRNGSSSNRDEMIILATFEIDCLFTNSNWQNSIIGNLPKSKSIYHYSLGETCFTHFAKSNFYLVPKIQYKNSKNFIELDKLEINLSIVSSEERKKANEMKGKIFAIQKAEARLFGNDSDDGNGVEEADNDTYDNSKNSRLNEEQQRRKKIALMTKSTSTLKATSSSSLHHSSSDHNQQPRTKQASQSSRIRTSQSVSPKVGTGGKTSSSSDLLFSSKPRIDTCETEEEDMPRLSTVRRRSEQGDSSLETPSRTRQRFGPASDLSPVAGSPYSDAVSPSLSVISSSTSRPRTANGGRSRPTTANSTKSTTPSSFSGFGNATTTTTTLTRPRSSAGLEHTTAVTSSAWSTFSNASTTTNLTIDATAAAELSQFSSSKTINTTSSSGTPSEPPSLSSMNSSSECTTSPSIDISPKSISSRASKQSVEREYHPPSTHATVNGLFADFMGFSLRPPLVTAVSDAQTNIMYGEKLIHPKAMGPHDGPSSYKGDSKSSSTYARTTLGHPGLTSKNKRKSGEISERAIEDGENTSNDSSLTSSASSPVIALREITLASPPTSVAMNPNTASQNSLSSPPASSTSYTLNSANMDKSASRDSHNPSSFMISSPMGTSSIYSKQQQQQQHNNVGMGSPKRGKSGGMSGAFSFFRRSSTRT